MRNRRLVIAASAVVVVVAPDLLVGTSAGALNIAYVASRPQTVATAGALERVWRGSHRVDMFPINPRAAIGGDDPPLFLLPRSYLEPFSRRGLS